MTLLVGVEFACAAMPAAIEAAKPAPADRIVKQTLKDAGYRSGDLLTKSQITSVLKQLEDAGYAIRRPKEILNRAVADDSSLRTQADTATGRKFLRKIGQIPGGYAHLDRLSELPQGERLIRQLQRDRGGEKMIEYLSTTNSGRRVGSMTAKPPQGVDLNAPTGRIYTGSDLLEVINQAIAKDLEAASTGKAER